MDEKPSSVTAAQLAEIIGRKLPPRPPPSLWERVRAVVVVLLWDRSAETRLLRYFVARITISILIGISLFVVGGMLGLTIAVILFAVGLALSVRLRWLSRVFRANQEQTSRR
jgi:hypothetical protein